MAAMMGGSFDDGLSLGHWLDDSDDEEAMVTSHGTYTTDHPSPGFGVPKLAVPSDCGDECVSLKAVGGPAGSSIRHDQGTGALADFVTLVRSVAVLRVGRCALGVARYALRITRSAWRC
jgi:hypothetical protein